MFEGECWGERWSRSRMSWHGGEERRGGWAIRTMHEKKEKCQKEKNEGWMDWFCCFCCWPGSWVLRDSPRPPNELFSSLLIYFCSLFNQLPMSKLRPFSFPFVSRIPLALLFFRFHVPLSWIYHEAPEGSSV